MTTENKQPISPLIRAKERVRKLKSFYKHLTAYILVSAMLLILSGRVTFVLLSKEALGNPEFLEWINWNLFGTPIIWGVVVLIHAAYVFMNSPFKRWEERQIQKFIKKDKEKTERYR
ncbi:2TM domain-containing protein [Croceitalea marina]|uniref:2TM domain-containing protein n=1 Tax=Croceitalea marina TaxID=1775166 RepID=A0ABW5MXD2_9FLAO